MSQQRVNFDPATGDQTGAALVKLDSNCADLDTRVSAAQTTANNAMPKTGGAFTGRISTPTFTTDASGGTTQGLFIGWNLLVPGSGSTDITCNQGGGSGGFRFRTINASNTVQTGMFFIDGLGRIGNEVSPASDNTYTCGNGSYRWSTMYAASGTISTSDAREKTDVSVLTDAELAASKELAREIGTYKWLAQVAAKGSAARLHIGMTVQRCMEIMTNHGLDPLAYGFICHDAWDEQPEILNAGQEEVVDPETGAVIQEAIQAGTFVVQAFRPAGDRYSFRMDELMFFIARGIDARLSAIEAQLSAPTP